MKKKELDTALHILKGAVQSVLGATLTTGTYIEGDKGRLTVQFGRKPEDGEIEHIEVSANEKIQEDVPVEHFEMNRTEAEEKFGDIIYDKFPVPAHISTLKILRIKDWNMNCCVGEHTKTTGEVGAIHITKHRFRNTKKELEISFSI